MQNIFKFQNFHTSIISLDPYNKPLRLADIIMPNLEKQEIKILME